MGRGRWEEDPCSKASASSVAEVVTNPCFNASTKRLRGDLGERIGQGVNRGDSNCHTPVKTSLWPRSPLSPLPSPLSPRGGAGKGGA